jgi:hypothetical protein
MTPARGLRGMRIRIEFYGIPRQRAAVPNIEMHCANRDAVQMTEVLNWLRGELPALAADCFTDDHRLRRGYSANINAERFVTDGDAALVHGDTLLLMSADAGG